MYQTFEAVWQQVGGVLEVTFSHDSAVSAGHDVAATELQSTMIYPEATFPPPKAACADLQLNFVDPEAKYPFQPR